MIERFPASGTVTTSAGKAPAPYHVTADRLTAADYSDETFFHYQYDAVGNRLQLDSSQDGVVTYQYDAANRLIEAGGVSYTWDNNGNLLSDGTSTYTYNYANRRRV